MIVISNEDVPFPTPWNTNDPAIPNGTNIKKKQNILSANAIWGVRYAVAAEYEQLSNRYSLAQMRLLLEKQSPELPEGYLKVWRSYCSVRDAALADNDTKELIHRRVLELQQKKKLTNYRLYKDLKLNPGNVNAWLKHNDSSKMSLDCARQIYKYAKSYPSVR